MYDKEAYKRFHAKHKDRIAEKRRENYDPEKERWLRLFYKYGITKDQYNVMWENQEGCCAICDLHQSESDRVLVVDHCHTTGEIRGLLCHICNSGIGKLKDSPMLLRKAADYLESVNEQI